MWECIALSKPQQKSLWCAVPLVNKIDAFSHSLGQQQTFSYAPTGSGTHGLIVVVPQG
jgi:hypothetical protein